MLTQPEANGPSNLTRTTVKVTRDRVVVWAMAMSMSISGLVACAPATTAGPAGTGGKATGTGGASAVGSGGVTPVSSGGTAPDGSGGSTTGGSSGTSTGGLTGSSGGATDTGSGGAGANGTATGGINGSSGGTSPTDGGAAGAAGTGGTGTDGGNADGGRDLYPLMKVLPLFTAPDVPVRGPNESPPSNQKWTPPTTLPTRMGKGIGQHPMLYVGENYNRIILVNEGQVIWTYDTAPGYELDDVWMLSNGNILYSHMTFIEEITPKKQVVWHYAPTAGEIHACQPIGLDKVFFVENALPMAHIRLYNKTTAKYEVDHLMAAAGSQHGQFRRGRMTGAGTYLLSFISGGKVVEFDKNFNMLWSFTSPQPWSAVRLKNGNTLIQDERDSTAKEVDAKGQIVWQLARTELALPTGTKMGNTQSCERLSSGNTVMFGNGGTNVANIQAVEVTPTKQVVWMLQDWMHLGDATSAQFLDEPGYPEVPGDTNH